MCVWEKNSSQFNFYVEWEQTECVLLNHGTVPKYEIHLCTFLFEASSENTIMINKKACKMAIHVVERTRKLKQLDSDIFLLLCNSKRQISLDINIISIFVIFPHQRRRIFYLNLYRYYKWICTIAWSIWIELFLFHFTNESIDSISDSIYLILKPLLNRKTSINSWNWWSKLIFFCLHLKCYSILSFSMLQIHNVELLRRYFSLFIRLFYSFKQAPRAYQETVHIL